MDNTVNHKHSAAGGKWVCYMADCGFYNELVGYTPFILLWFILKK